MVAEHRERRLRQLLDEPPQPRLAVRPSEQVAGQRDQVRPALGGPRDAALHRPHAGRRDAEMEVREVSDPEAVELRRQPRHVDLELAQPRPARLDEAPADRYPQKRQQAKSSGAAPQWGRAGIRPSTH